MQATRAQAKTSKKKPRSMWQGTPFSATVSLKFFVTKQVALHVSLKLASGRPPNKVAELMVPVKTLL